jgi:hypothetical protein
MYQQILHSRPVRLEIYWRRVGERYGTHALPCSSRLRLMGPTPSAAA